MTNNRNTWWSEVSGPSRFIDAVIKTAASQKSSIMVLPKEIPFEEDFYSILESKLRDELAGQDVEVLEGVYGTVSDYFLNLYCKKELRTSFRPKPNYSAAKFLAEAEATTMHGRGFIVRLCEPSELGEWTKFATEYSSSVSKKVTPAVFVLAIQGGEAPKTVKGIKRIDYKDYSTHFDAYAYSVIQAAEINEKSIIKSYLADLAASISDGNVEQAQQAIYIYREFLNDPVVFAERHLGKTDREGLEKKVWESQLKCIFPLLEKYRSSFVESHKREIEPNLGTLIDPFGDPYENAEDIELGTLFFMARKGMLQLDSVEYNDLKNRANARNELAHINVLSYEAIRDLI